MPLVNMKDLLNHAHRHRYAVAAFEVADLTFLTGYMRAAEEVRAPIVFNVPAASRCGIDLPVVLGAVRAAADAAKVPVAIQLDHAHQREETERGIRYGCNGVMIDGSEMPLPQNIALTKEVVAMAHGCGIPVEAELGCVPTVGNGGGLELTTVAEARGVVERTNVDFLAVSVGTVHGRLKGKPRLDTTRLRQINEALGIPLVIHGGTGLDETQIQRLVANGAAKINFFTALDEAAGKVMGGAKGTFSERQKNIIDIIAETAAHYLRYTGAAGRAAEVLTRCRSGETVEHLVIYNLSINDEARANELMRMGREVLGNIPGVQKVFTSPFAQIDR